MTRENDFVTRFPELAEAVNNGGGAISDILNAFEEMYNDDFNKAREMSDSVGNVYRTYNYDLFKHLLGNREAAHPRVKIIANSIKINGWIKNPIVVNEKLEILDGEGRFNALKSIGMPIEYVVYKGGTIEDCIALNIKQKNWRTDDYVNCYADLGYEHYIELVKLEERYKGRLTNNTIIQIAGNAYGDTVGSLGAIKSGNYRIIDRDSVEKRIEFCIDMLSIIGKEKGRVRLWTDIFKFIYYTDTINKEVLKNKLNKYINNVNAIVTIKQGIRELEDLYNSGRNHKIYFMPEYDKYKRASFC